MTSKHDDQLLQHLYRQQVQQTHVPEQLKSSLLAQNKQQHKGWHWQKIIAIFALSGGISFSIFALITHFYPPATTHNTTTINTKRTIPVTLKQEQTKPESIVITVEPLPEPPKTSLPPKPEAKSISPSQPSVAQSLQQPTVQLSSSLSQSAKISLAKPLLLTHKVLPDYPKAALIEGLSATVKLSYVVSSNGQVSQIEVLSNSPKVLNKAAISALQQWQFSPQTEAANEPASIYQVEFVFKLPE